MSSTTKELDVAIQNSLKWCDGLGRYRQSELIAYMTLIRDEFKRNPSRYLAGVLDTLTNAFISNGIDLGFTQITRAQALEYRGDLSSAITCLEESVYTSLTPEFIHQYNNVFNYIVDKYKTVPSILKNLPVLTKSSTNDDAILTYQQYILRQQQKQQQNDDKTSATPTKPSYKNTQSSSSSSLYNLLPYHLRQPGALTSTEFFLDGTDVFYSDPKTDETILVPPQVYTLSFDSDGTPSVIFHDDIVSDANSSLNIDNNNNNTNNVLSTPNQTASSSASSSSYSTTPHKDYMMSPVRPLTPAARSYQTPSVIPFNHSSTDDDDDDDDNVDSDNQTGRSKGSHDCHKSSHLQVQQTSLSPTAKVFLGIICSALFAYIAVRPHKEPEPLDIAAYKKRKAEALRTGKQYDEKSIKWVPPGETSALINSITSFIGLGNVMDTSRESQAFIEAKKEIAQLYGDQYD